MRPGQKLASGVQLRKGDNVNTSMKATIENSYLRIAVKEKGGELCSLFKKETQTEYLWQAGPDYWNRHAPVLFPIVGALKDGIYYYDGKCYKMGQHGLARDLPFTLAEKKDNELAYSLKSNPFTLERYPFDFELQVIYTIQENRLMTTYRVINPSDKKLYFSIGGHPAFNCPLYGHEKRSDYQLVFEQPEIANIQRIINGFRNGVRELILDGQRHLPVTEGLFRKDALIFKSLKSSSVTLQKGEEPVLSLDFTGFPYLGVWSKSATAPFVCIEPWFGLTDHTLHNQQLTEKEGVVALEAHEEFRHAYTITIH